MLTIRHQVSLAENRPVVFSPAALVSGSPQERPVATTSSQWYTHRYAGPLQNGRLSARLAGTNWRVRWNASLKATAAAVLRTTDRVLVQASGWRLFGLDGKMISEGPAGNCAISADPGAGLFYLINGASYLEARSLQDGELRFQSPLLTNERFTWPLIARLGRRLMMMGVEQASGGPSRRPGARSEIDMMEIDSPLKLDVYKQILSLKRSEILHFDRASMIFAAGDERFYGAAPDYLVVGRSGLEVDAVYRAQFNPKSISVDEAGSVYLIVETGGVKAFWAITRDGKQFIQAVLSAEHQSAVLPPVIAHNHQVYLLTRSSVVAFSNGGAIRWERPLAGEIAGASVTADDKLLVAAGSDLTVFDGEGHQVGQHRFDGETLTSAPVLTGNELLIGTSAHVYSLA